MATQLQLRKGTKIQNDAFTGAEAELTYDSTTKGLRIHDGSTQGGINVAHLSMPDYGAGTNITTFPFSTPSDGYVMFKVAGGEYGGITINGTVQFQISGGSFGEQDMVPVAKGDTITTNDNNDGRIFFPCKGV